MWPRKQLDLGATDLAYGLWQIVAAYARPSAVQVVGSGWVPADDAIVSLSVRTGWDLLLTALDLPPGGEVITTAVTIPDMVRIIEHHGLAPVAVDIDAARLEPDVAQVERLITPRTRLILIAHLFGSRVEMGPFIELARRHGLLVVEDCAQAFVGKEYAGHSESDCVLFSFGPIKTATALGGAILRVRDGRLRARMANLQRSYPVQSRVTYLKRWLKYSAFWLLGKPTAYGCLVRGMLRFGVDYDRVLGNAAHSFRSSEFFTQIRRQPCVPLARMLGWRIKTFEARGLNRLRRRTARGEELSRALGGRMVVGEQNPTHTYWVMPVRVSNREDVVEQLRDAGFDATTRSSIIVVPRNTPLAQSDPRGTERGRDSAAAWLGEVVFLPGGEQLPEAEWQRMLADLRQTARTVDSRAERELAAICGVSGAS